MSALDPGCLLWIHAGRRCGLRGLGGDGVLQPSCRRDGQCGPDRCLWMGSFRLHPCAVDLATYTRSPCCEPKARTGFSLRRGVRAAVASIARCLEITPTQPQRVPELPARQAQAWPYRKSSPSRRAASSTRCGCRDRSTGDRDIRTLRQGGEGVHLGKYRSRGSVAARPWRVE